MASRRAVIGGALVLFVLITIWRRRQRLREAARLEGRLRERYREWHDAHDWVGPSDRNV